MTRQPSVRIPDSKLCLEITEVVRDTESELLFNHSSRTYQFAAMTGERRGLRFDPELLYAAAMFHDMGLTEAHSSADKRFEVDGAFVVGAGDDLHWIGMLAVCADRIDVVVAV